MSAIYRDCIGGNSLACAQAQCDLLHPFHFWSQSFYGRDRRLVGKQAARVFVMIGDVLPALETPCGKCAWAQPEIICAAPAWSSPLRGNRLPFLRLRKIRPPRIAREIPCPPHR